MGRKHYGWLLRKAQDREKWRQFIAAYLQPVNGTYEDEEDFTIALFEHRTGSSKKSCPVYVVVANEM